MGPITTAPRRDAVINIAVPVASVRSRPPAAVMSVVVNSLVQVELQLVIAKPKAIQEKNKCGLYNAWKTSTPVK